MYLRDMLMLYVYLFTDNAFQFAVRIYGEMSLLQPALHDKAHIVCTYPTVFMFHTS